MSVHPALAGMGLMVAASLCFSGMAVTYRAAMAEGLPTVFAPFARGLFSLLFLLPWLWRAGLAGLATRRPWPMLGRCAAGIFSFQCWMIALMLLPIADAVAIAQARPIWAIFLAALLLGEALRRDRLAAALVGFVGVLIIAGPTGALSWGVLAAVGAGVGGALVLIAFRALAPTEPPLRVVTWYALAAVLFWAPACAVFWVTPSSTAVLLLVAGSGLAVLGDWLASLAARRAEAGLLAPMEYSQIPAGILLGWAVFAELPGWTLPIGVLLMLGASLYLARSAGR
ncbi:MAG: DMT family transporter [Rhodovarius sp.]|nr:DMT family transporter [Rhodovarius sp.]MDW8314738.1 DMT family transporter [Rhodovarius sp.]